VHALWRIEPARGLELARAAVADARAERYPPLLAEALDELARFQDERGETRSAEASALEAIAVAQEAHDDRRLAHAAISVAHMYLNDRQTDSAAIWLRLARATLRRLGGNDRIEGRLCDQEAQLLREQKRFAEAAPLAQQALAQAERDRREPADLAVYLMNAGSVDVYVEPERARVEFERALAIYDKLYGAAHPWYANVLVNLGELAREQHRFADYEQLNRRALTIDEKAYPQGHMTIAVALLNIADALVRQGRHADALPYFERGMALADRALGPDNGLATQSMPMLTRALVELRRWHEAQPLLEHMLQPPVVGTLAVDEVADAQFRLGQALWNGPGERVRARALVRQAAAGAQPLADDEAASRRTAIASWLLAHASPY
jgi:tetratricopeptide (TPR) repeat protein